jgi:pimeloyl-ACP methyl ester carboxylesterase
MADRFQVIVWDLPGLGQSPEPLDGRYTLERMAQNLKAVLGLASGRPAILVGHSIGGMTILTLCRLFPELFTDSIAGIVLTNSTDRTPTKTSTAGGLMDALLRPVFVPLLHVVRWLSPLFWVSQWIGYFNGSAHIVAALTGFAGTQTRGQIERAAYLSTIARPSVLARGALAMAGYDEAETLRSVPVPILLVTGSLDRLTVPEASRAMSQKARHADLVRLAPAGHQGVWERHAEFSLALAAFVARSADGAKESPGSTAA